MSDIEISEIIHTRDVASEGRGARIALIGLAVVFLLGFLFLPLIVVIVEGFRNGPAEFLKALADPDAWAAVKLTLLVAAIAVPFNAAFGAAAAWAIAKFDFRGKNLLFTLSICPSRSLPSFQASSMSCSSGRRVGWVLRSRPIILKSFSPYRELCLLQFL